MIYLLCAEKRYRYAISSGPMKGTLFRMGRGDRFFWYGPKEVHFSAIGFDCGPTVVLYVSYGSIHYNEKVLFYSTTSYNMGLAD